MFIGEAPGADEDRLGAPFVGRSGQLLQNILNEIGFTRNQVFIANTIKCRPPQNRDPTQEEKETCSPHLKKQIELIKPLILVPLGRVSMELFISDKTITQARGKLHQAPLPQHLTYEDAPVQNIYPVYHPAYAARNPAHYTTLSQDLLVLPNLLHNIKYPNKE